MLYYNSRLDLIGELSVDVKYLIAYIKLSENNEFMVLTPEWERIGLL